MTSPPAHQLWAFLYRLVPDSECVWRPVLFLLDGSVQAPAEPHRSPAAGLSSDQETPGPGVVCALSCCYQSGGARHRQSHQTPAGGWSPGDCSGEGRHAVCTAQAGVCSGAGATRIDRVGDTRVGAGERAEAMSAASAAPATAPPTGRCLFCWCTHRQHMDAGKVATRRADRCREHVVHHGSNTGHRPSLQGTVLGGRDWY